MVNHKNKKDELENRLKSLVSNNNYYLKAFGYRTEIINGLTHGIDMSTEMALWDRDNINDFESKILKLEEAKKDLDEETAKNKPLKERKIKYQEIDHLLFEAIAEKENGRPEKMKAYLVLRAKIKKEIPK